MMRKIILAFDGDNFSKGAFEFARQLNEQNPILLSGIFLPQVVFNSLISSPHAGLAVPVYIPLTGDESYGAIEKNIDHFETVCLKNGIEYRVHKNFSDFPLPVLKEETRFADLLILGSESFYEELGTGRPNVFLENALQDSECPVIVVPEDFTFPQTIILTYDGSKNSVHAIKQFSYLFPELVDKKTLAIFSENGNESFPEKWNIEELVARHFSDLTFMSTGINFQKFFSTWSIQMSIPIVVAGSYGRTGFSQLFKKSFLAEIIASHKTPVFIAHR